MFLLVVAGGLCNKELGSSWIKFNILGCPWSEVMQQNVYKKLYQTLPAQVLEVQVVDFRDQPDGPEKENSSRYTFLVDYFQGVSPKKRTIDMRETENEENLIAKEIEGRKEFEGNTGTGNTESFDSAADGSAGDFDEMKETVRFQYDGVLKMEVTVDSTYNKLSCDGYEELTLADRTSSQSFHVVDYMSLFQVRIDLEYEIIPGSETSLPVVCDILDQEDHKIEITNNVGIDDVAGILPFYKKLTEEEQEALSICSTIAPPIPADATASGPCLVSITHNEEGKDAGLDYWFATGRPNPFKPYTKNINFKVIGGARDVKHVAEFFIEGLYSKGDGNSFALPTHDPIMILRDPPGMLFIITMAFSFQLCHFFLIAYNFCFDNQVEILQQPMKMLRPG